MKNKQKLNTLLSFFFSLLVIVHCHYVRAETSFSIQEVSSGKPMLFKLAAEDSDALTQVYPELLNGQLNGVPSPYRFALLANPIAVSNPDALYAKLTLDDGTTITIFPEIKSELKILADQQNIIEEQGEYIFQADAIAADGSTVKANIIEVYPDYYLNEE